MKALREYLSPDHGVSSDVQGGHSEVSVAQGKAQ